MVQRTVADRASGETDDKLLRLDCQEEHEPAQNQPGPNCQRDRRRLEQLLERLFGRRLLSVRHSQSIPADFSAHASTLIEQYRLEDGLHRLSVRSTSSYAGKPRTAVDLKDYADLSLVAILEGGGGGPSQRPTIAEGDLLLVRGDAAATGRLAAEMHLAIRQDDESASVAETLFNRATGLAEIVIPPRSALVGQMRFPAWSPATAI